MAPRDPKVFMGLGNAYELRTQWQEAEEAFRTALSLAAGLPVGELNIYRDRFAYFLTHKGDIEQAVAVQQFAVRDAPSDPWVRIHLAYLLHRRSDDSGAFRELREAQNLGGRDAGVLTSVGSGFARQGLLREAIDAYEGAARLGPLDADRWMELAELYSRAGRREPAIGAYRQVLARQPEHKAAQQALLSLGADAASATARP
jgi:Flp pilus assembly protein TadD